jgi:endonuclease/exonuclease/phosphatase family metal-dependent hydrolase
MMRLVSYNIQFGAMGRETAIADVLRAIEPDVVVLQEAVNTRVVDRVAEAVGFPHWYARRGYSLALMSRLPVSECNWVRPQRMRHMFLRAMIGDLPIFGVHLQPYFSRWSERQRVREVTSLLQLAEPYRERPHVLLGDFNAISPRDVVEMRRMPRWIRLLIRVGAGQIATRAIQTVLDNDYLDSYRTLYPDQPGPTLPSWSPYIRLDYAFLPTSFRECLAECVVITNDGVGKASDHCPLLTVLNI